MTKWTIEPAQCGDTVTYLRAKLAEAEARVVELETVLDDAERNSRISSNGNMWRWWSDKAREVAANNTALKARARESALTELSALGQAAEAYEAQLAAEAQRDKLAETVAIQARILLAGAASQSPRVIETGRRLQAALDALKGTP